jgi:hypothetical protein
MQESIDNKDQNIYALEGDNLELKGEIAALEETLAKKQDVEAQLAEALQRE